MPDRNPYRRNKARHDARFAPRKPVAPSPRDVEIWVGALERLSEMTEALRGRHPMLFPDPPKDPVSDLLGLLEYLSEHDLSEPILPDPEDGSGSPSRQSASVGPQA